MKPTASCPCVDSGAVLPAVSTWCSSHTPSTAALRLRCFPRKRCWQQFGALSEPRECAREGWEVVLDRHGPVRGQENQIRGSFSLSIWLTSAIPTRHEGRASDLQELMHRRSEKEPRPWQASVPRQQGDTVWAHCLQPLWERPRWSLTLLRGAARSSDALRLVTQVSGSATRRASRSMSDLAGIGNGSHQKALCGRPTLQRKS